MLKDPTSFKNICSNMKFSISKVRCDGTRGRPGWPAVWFGMSLCHFVLGLHQHNSEGGERMNEERKGGRERERERVRGLQEAARGLEEGLHPSGDQNGVHRVSFT